MKLKVLGSSSSGNCYLLQNNETTLILECGLPFKSIQKGLDFNLSNVVGCLVSHEHNDHAKAIREVLRAGIDVYSSTGTIREYLKEEYALNTYKRLHFIKSEQQESICDFKTLPFKTEHDAAEPLGFLIQHEEMGKLLFLTDSYYCQYNFIGLNHIIIECNYSEKILHEMLDKDEINPYHAKRLMKSHFSLENLKEFLSKTDLSQVRDIILLHLSDGNSNAVEFKDEIERLTGKPTYSADKGLEVELGGI